MDEWALQETGQYPAGFHGLVEAALPQARWMQRKRHDAVESRGIKNAGESLAKPCGER